jgi:ankyrin repeat protein
VSNIFDYLRAGAKEKAKARGTDQDGQLPLHFACVNNAPVEVVILLLEAYPDGNAACPRDG